MNIAMLLLNRGRGSGEVAREHAKYLMQAGHSVYFVSPHAQKVDGALFSEVKLPSEITPVHEYLPSAKNQKCVADMSYEEVSAYVSAYEAGLEAIVEDLDIIIGHHANLTAIAAANVAKRHHKPYTLFIHGTGIEPRHHGGYDEQVWQQIRESIERADGILVTTEYVRDSLILPLADVPKERFLILPCGVDLQDFHPKNIDGIRRKFDLPETYVICPGALTKSKGPQNVVAASEYYSDRAYTIFIGDGELRGELEEALGKRGRFLGFVSSDDKAQLINAATLLVAAPEKAEHFGIIYAEALAGGTPVVAYGGGGVPSVVTPNVGVLTERSPRELGKAIARLLDEPHTRKQMSENARPRAEENYNYPMLVKRLENWLGGMVN